MAKTFRLLDYEPFDGATNMAIDEAMLEACLAGDVPPTLRFYSFSPPCVSLGYSQSLPVGQIEKIRRRGFDVVRRPTGGRAVLHCKELTYCFVGTTCGEDGDGPGILSASVGAAYKQICQGLILGIRNLGVPLEIGETKSARKQPHDCFLATTAADLHYRGMKMVGSAQLRRKFGVLQHGSILLAQEQSLMSDLLISEGESDSDSESGSHHANLFDVLGQEVSMIQLQDSIVEGFKTAFSCEFGRGELSQVEKKLIDGLRSKSVVNVLG